MFSARAEYFHATERASGIHRRTSSSLTRGSRVLANNVNFDSSLRSRATESCCAFGARSELECDTGPPMGGAHFREPNAMSGMSLVHRLDLKLLHGESPVRLNHRRGPC